MQRVSKSDSPILKTDTSSARNLPDVGAIMGGDFQKGKGFDLQSFLFSDSARIILTFILFIILFAVTFFVAYWKIKQQQFSEGTKVVPEAEIRLPK